MTQTDERGLISAASAMAKTADDKIIASAIAWISDVQISYSGLLALNLAPKTATFSVSGAKVGDRIYAHRRERPTLAGVNVLAGVMIEGTGYVPADGSVEIYHVIPAIGVGQTLLIPLRLVAYRAATT